jgi:hypothetical protein
VPTPLDAVEPEVIEIGEPDPMLIEDVDFAQDVIIDDISDEAVEYVSDGSEAEPVEISEPIPPIPDRDESEMAAPTPQPEQDQPVSFPPEEDDKTLSVPVGEPEPDKRYQITLRGSQPKYPKNYCAHCLRTPVKLKTIMRGNLPDPKNPGQRKLVPLELPFCKDCQRRMDSRSRDENNARMIAFLVSAVVSIIAIVVPLVFGFLDFESNAFLSITLLLVFGVLGFSIPLLIWYFMANDYPPPRDAAFVLSTLLVLDSGADTTLFEWRNHGYAELFRQVNIENVEGNLILVDDRTTFTEVQPEIPPEEPPEEPAQPVDETQPEEESPSSDEEVA